MKQIAILALVITLSLQKCNLEDEGVGSCQSFHTRVVYFNQDDNICQGDQQNSRRDVLKLVIEHPDQEIQDLLVTLTSCNLWALTNWGQISILPTLTYRWNRREDGSSDKIIFKQQKSQIIYENIVLGVTIKTSIEEPATINGVPHSCVVEGDGNVYLFGYYKDRQPPTIKVSCNRNVNLMTE